MYVGTLQYPCRHETTPPNLIRRADASTTVVADTTLAAVIRGKKGLKKGAHTARSLPHAAVKGKLFIGICVASTRLDARRLPSKEKTAPALALDKHRSSV